MLRGELRKMQKDICSLRKRFYIDYGDEMHAMEEKIGLAGKGQPV